MAAILPDSLAPTFADTWSISAFDLVCRYCEVEKPFWQIFINAFFTVISFCKLSNAPFKLVLTALLSQSVFNFFSGSLNTDSALSMK